LGFPSFLMLSCEKCMHVYVRMPFYAWTGVGVYLCD